MQDKQIPLVKNRYSVPDFGLGFSYKIDESIIIYSCINNESLSCFGIFNNVEIMVFEKWISKKLVKINSNQRDIASYMLCYPTAIEAIILENCIAS